jgi:peptidoglycan/xylan/chitin deacetylase (PgdA/CDA1 family)
VISSDNIPLNRQSSDVDFTVKSYRELLAIAKQAYAFVCYNAIPWGQRFVLWRHDCDYSLNRAHALARVEAEEGVRATYFLNLHCEFYNLFEKGQHRLVREIIEMGHEIGLHFDAAFHDISDEEKLEQQVGAEAQLLERLYGVKPSAFSFHNPVAAHMSCEAETYGGVVNCYSRRLKTEIPYCSDSNGYWRFRRLQDVLTNANDPCLQVLTHPGWWQETAMPPRRRIFRSVYGRAKATMRLYDAGLDAHGRQNIAGARDALRPISAIDPDAWELCDLLWNRGDFPALFCELWRLFDRRLQRVLMTYLQGELHVSADAAQKLLREAASLADGMTLAELVLQISRRDIGGESSAMHDIWLAHRGELMNGQELDDSLLEQGCVYLCGVIQSIAEGAKISPVGGVASDWEGIVRQVETWRLANVAPVKEEKCG